MKKTSGFVGFMYGTVIGRAILKVFMKLHMDRLVIRFLWSSASRKTVGWYVKKNQIPLSEEEVSSFRSFRDFFVRTREDQPFDMTEGHLISPCDGWLSAFPITPDSCFEIKNSHYRIRDFLQDEELAERYRDGLCLVFRLCASDYHHYSYIDSGYQGENHPIPGILHSVQPIACEKYPIYVLNKRSWCLLNTDHFGPVVQCEIGALVVGGIVNKIENGPFAKGQEKGNFELAGSTIVMLFERDRIELNQDVVTRLSEAEEARVLQHEWIGIQKES